jgi:hypothetical protein
MDYFNGARSTSTYLQLQLERFSTIPTCPQSTWRAMSTLVALMTDLGELSYVAEAPTPVID